MSLSLSKSVSAMAVGRSTSVLGIGGTAPYTYSVLPNGAGGSIDPASGRYTAPAAVNRDVRFTSDTIQVKDSLSATAHGNILVTDALGLFAQILQSELGLASDHIYFWDQKIFQPKDSSLYLAISVERVKPFANVNEFDGVNLISNQYLSVMATLGVDIISRSNEALYRKEEVLLALNSNYSRFQQNANSFLIGQLPAGSDFINLSTIDGAAIPYRFRISVNIQYAYTKTQAVPYFDTFAQPEVTTEP